MPVHHTNPHDRCRSGDPRAACSPEQAPTLAGARPGAWRFVTFDAGLWSPARWHAAFGRTRPVADATDAGPACF